MQRDKRIGLALAILLIGFATAFCFRPEQGDLFLSPQLGEPEVIDSQLASQKNVPYLESLEDKKNVIAENRVEKTAQQSDQPVSFNEAK